MLITQIGSVSYITLFCLILLHYGKKIAYINSKLEMTVFGSGNKVSFLFMFSRVLMFVFITELIGAILLMGVFIPLYGWVRGIFTSIFFAVSAFSNAGYILTLSGSVSFLSANILFNIAMLFVMIIGSIGFAAAVDILTKRSFFLYEINTKLVIWCFVISAVLGAFCLFISRVVSGDGFNAHTAASSLFLSVSAKGAGYSVVNIMSLSEISKVALILLMFIGASPASSSLGTNSLSIIICFLLIIKLLRKDKTVSVMGRFIDVKTIRRAVCYFLFSLFFCIVLSILLNLLSKAAFIDCIFDAVSAFMCCGLSTGVITQMGITGNVICCAGMLSGRFGIIFAVYCINKLPVKYTQNQFSYMNDSNLLI